MGCGTQDFFWGGGIMGCLGYGIIGKEVHMNDDLLFVSATKYKPKKHKN